MAEEREVDLGHVVAAILLIVGGWAALSIDFVRAGGGIKGDEATYVTMALSVAYDGDLAYERADLERFYRIYNAGPEGVFLKRPAHFELRLQGSVPFVRLASVPDTTARHLYFGKAFIYPLVAAPFVRLMGLNGLPLFNVLLMLMVFLAGYRYLSAQSSQLVALLYATAFFGASIVPVYMVWLTSELFNVACVFLAFFFWFYREVAPPAAGPLGRLVRGRTADVIGAVLLGMATFSKPPNVLLIAPIVLWRSWQRRAVEGIVVGAIFGAVVAGGFAINGLVTGDFNYQGGERRTYYGRFPFESADIGFADRGIPVSTDEGTFAEPLQDNSLVVLMKNVQYFFVGRHFGFVPFFFPGVVTLALAAWRWRTLQAWHLLTLAAVCATAAALLILLPYQWSGGGGPSGNRYFLSIYPVLLFLTPAMATPWPGMMAWLGGAVFTAQILVNPFVSADLTYLAPQRGAFRLLPVELTMVTDLPVMLSPSRQRVPVGKDPTLLLYFLDENASRPESPGIWVRGNSRADVIVRTDVRLDAIELILESPVRNRVTIDAGRGRTTVDVEPGRPYTFIAEASGVQTRRGWACVLSIQPTAGFVPRLVNPESNDPRYLGVAVKLAGKPSTLK